MLFIVLSFISLLMSFLRSNIIVLTKNGARPIKYGIKLNSDDKYRDIRKPLSKYTEIDEDRLLFIELNGSHVKVGGLLPIHERELNCCLTIKCVLLIKFGVFIIERICKGKVRTSLLSLNKSHSCVVN